MLLIASLAFGPAWAFDEALPIAPKRSDDRDRLPTAPFVSLTGQDPFLPEEEGQRSVAGQGKSSVKNTTAKQKKAPKQKSVSSKPTNSKSAKKVGAVKPEPRASKNRAPAQKVPAKPKAKSKSKTQLKK